MQPDIQLNWLAILVAILAHWLIGALWYGPLLGKSWMREMGWPVGRRPDRAAMMRGMLIGFLGTVLMGYVLAWAVQGWRPSVWGVGEDMPAYAYGFCAAFFSWLGFVVPVMLNGVAYEGKSWRLFAINAGYQLVGLLTMGMILAYWR